MKRWPIILQVTGAIILLLILVNLDLITYGLRQGKGQFGIIAGARSVKEVLRDPEISDSIKYKLNLVQSARQFGIDLGLKESDLYTTVNLEKDQYVMYVVTGSAPYALNPYLWKFPVAGEVPYKGFFDVELAVQERDKLREDGWDAGIRTAGGWSTLGWFENPLLYEMLERPVGDLVNLVIHELAHESLYIPDSSELNENLATFVGDEATLIFLEEKFGSDSKELKEYLQSEEDSKLYADHFLRGADELDRLFKSFSLDTPDSIKNLEKSQLIKTVVEGVDTLHFNNPEEYSGLFDEYLPNNTYFLSFLRYRSNQDSYYEEYTNKFESDFVAYIKELIRKHGA